MTNQLKTDLLEETGNLLRKISHDYQEYMMTENNQISMHQMYFLNYLDQKKTLTPSKIAERYGITLGAVTGFIDRLYKLGLITRTRSEADRRLVLIELTAQGKQQIQTVGGQCVRKHNEILERFGQDEILQLNRSLNKFRLVLDELKEKG